MVTSLNKLKFQQTIKGEVEVSGIGLHTGLISNITLKPAPSNYGIIFKRIDLEGILQRMNRSGLPFNKVLKEFKERQGSNVTLMYFEYRFPFLFAFGPPKRITATYLFGHFFYDIGAAWDQRKEFWDEDLLSQKYNDESITSPIISGFGTGFKLFTPFGLLRIDVAWDIEDNGGYSKPQYYFSFGADW